jgi:hypothetical protein
MTDHSSRLTKRRLGSSGQPGRELFDRLAIPQPWWANIDVSLALIDDLDLRIAELTVDPKR